MEQDIIINFFNQYFQYYFSQTFREFKNTIEFRSGVKFLVDRPEIQSISIESYTNFFEHLSNVLNIEVLYDVYSELKLVLKYSSVNDDTLRVLLRISYYVNSLNDSETANMIETMSFHEIKELFIKDENFGINLLKSFYQYFILNEKEKISLIEHIEDFYKFGHVKKHNISENVSLDTQNSLFSNEYCRNVLLYIYDYGMQMDYDEEEIFNIIDNLLVNQYDIDDPFDALETVLGISKDMNPFLCIQNITDLVLADVYELLSNHDFRRNSEQEDEILLKLDQLLKDFDKMVESDEDNEDEELDEAEDFSSIYELFPDVFSSLKERFIIYKIFIVYNKYKREHKDNAILLQNRDNLVERDKIHLLKKVNPLYEIDEFLV